MINNLNNWFKKDLGHYTFPIGCNTVFELTIQHTYVNYEKCTHIYSLVLVFTTLNGKSYDRELLGDNLDLESCLNIAKQRYIELINNF